MTYSTGWTDLDIPSLRDRVIVITGANSGLGLASALATALHGATVLLACRDEARAAAALESVAGVATGAPPAVVPLDLADLDSIEACAKQITTLHDHIDVLMNNAGVMAIPQRRTPAGFEMQFGTNHLGHFALTAHLLPLLVASNEPRVVTTASHAHRLGHMAWEDLNWESRTYRRWPAYAQSKLANLLFSAELARRAHDSGTALKSIAAHPGYASTGLQQVGPAMSNRPLTARIMSLGNRIAGQSAARGALPQLFAATSPAAESGAYYGPDGFGQLRGTPQQVHTSHAAADIASAQKLWLISEAMSGTKFDWGADTATNSG